MTDDWLSDTPTPRHVVRRFDPDLHRGELFTTRDPKTGELLRCAHCGDPALIAWERLPAVWNGTAIRWCDPCIPHREHPGHQQAA